MFPIQFSIPWNWRGGGGQKSNKIQKMFSTNYLGIIHKYVSIFGRWGDFPTSINTTMAKFTSPPYKENVYLTSIFSRRESFICRTVPFCLIIVCIMQCTACSGLLKFSLVHEMNWNVPWYLFITKNIHILLQQSCV